jgi:imidazolonepropionase-like amidohydrolase
MVDSPSVSRRRAISRSRASRGCVFIASRPPDRKVSRHAVRRAAGTLSSRASRSIASPRRSRHTTAVFFCAENRSALAPSRAVALLVTLHAASPEAGGIPSWGIIGTPPRPTLPYSVSNETMPQWSMAVLPKSKAFR